ncbi:hypothetical protein CC2G_001355 [Coprinopsis cinerea AmutBmut pab1-1]|nr:hypothetical protein CC2G_001355 [Coprinopsis cinerea AmutBmut pab1-1]
MAPRPTLDLSPEHTTFGLEFPNEAHTVEDIQKGLNGLDPDSLNDLGVDTVLKGLLASTQPFPKLLELVLSYGGWSSQLRGWLSKSFPATRPLFLESVHQSVLERVALCLNFLPIGFSREQSQIISQWYSDIESCLRILRSLGSLTFDHLDQPEDQLDLEGFGEFVTVKQKQKQRKKKAKRAPTTQSAPLNLKDFERMDLDPPQCQGDVDALTVALLGTLRLTFERYMDLLARDFVYLAIQETSVVSVVEVDTPDTSPDPSVQQHVEDAPLDEDSTPAAYPLVQPMKAALYFDSADGLGEWRILISTRADRDLRDWRRRDSEFFRIIIKKIKELSCGHFSADNQKRLNGANADFAIFEAKMTRDTRLVYQIDCVPEYDNNYERQVIKIFGIYTHAQIDKRLWNSMGYQLARRGKVYRDRCKFRSKPRNPGDNVFAPASFPPVEVEEKDTLVIPELPKEDLEEIHSLLVLEKFVMLSQELLNSILADLDVAHVFNVTPQEKEIIEHPYSCYVLGRSGTGKTTTMLFKMLGIERAYGLQTDASVTKPRQIFVTQSRVLATRVEEYFAKLLDSLAAAKKSRKELKEIAKEKKAQQEETSAGLYDQEDDVTWKAGLPQKFSLLEDEHFPLFVTYEKLSQLLEGDILDDDPTSPKSPVGRNGRFITYDVFMEQYWPHFPQNLTKNLDPSLVFSELIGVIEGSEASLSCASRYLDRSAYENLSHRTQHVFAKQRETVYAIYSAYLKRKCQNGDLDVADRTHRILKAFELRGVPGTKIDYLYVDEAQDNLLIDAMLLRSLCRNPDGLFWAGDTAQTIAIGSSFRFDDLKAFLYRLEKRREDKLDDSRKGAQGELRTFQLAINYRSHGGIVQCAHSVIELITHFWPYAIDSMAPEQGIVDGAKPVFFSGWDTNTVRYEQFLFGDSGDRIEFGARQCILVRDEIARTELREQVGDIGLILTLYESKGLEFDDVLLYKFFEDSKIDLGQWRVVLNLVEAANGTQIAPRFDETRHAGVCSELKFLYVAITRARKNLWIVDCSDKAEPMKVLWTAKDYIQNCAPGTDVPRLAVSSTPEEWAKTGRTLFTNRRYLQSMHAFQRAGMEREVKIAHTHFLREEARSAIATNKEGMLSKQNAFVVAAESFLECAAFSTGKRRKVFYHNAADCFERAAQLFDMLDLFARAAKAYEDAEEYTPAVRLYRKCDKFDEAVNIVVGHKGKVDQSLAENVVDVARLFYFKQRELKKAQKLFESVEEQLEYLEDNVLLDECHAAVLVELGRYQEAADVHLAEGRTLEAIETLLEDQENPESTKRANTCILQGLWQNVSFAVLFNKENETAHRMLELASKLNTMSLTVSERDEVAMFRNIKDKNLGALRQLGIQFLKRNEKVPALVCFDYCFMALPVFSGLSNAKISVILDDFMVYCRLMREVASNLNLDSPGIQRLFALTPAASENMFHVPRGTWVYHRLKAISHKEFLPQHDEESPIISRQTIVEILKFLLWSRLVKRILEENELCQRTKAFSPCLPFIMNEECHLQNCHRQHIDYKDLTQEWYTAQIRMYLQQILIFHTLFCIPFELVGHRLKEQRFLIRKLFDTLHPPVHYLGTAATLRLDLIPESQKALETVKNWCRDLIHSHPIPPPRGPDQLALTWIYEASVLCLTVDKYEASKYLPQGAFLRTFERFRHYYRNVQNDSIYVIPELIQALQASDTTFLSAGILCLKQIIDCKLPVDINVARHLVEFLAGAMILARVEFKLHNVTLPRSWFISLLHHVSRREKADTRLFDQLLDCIEQLIKVLVTPGGDGANYLLFENKSLSDLPAIRELHVAPFCRAMALLGYNIASDQIRTEILRRLRPLHPVKSWHWTYRQYASARSWGGIVRALRESTTESALDDLVVLCDESKPANKPPPSNVTRVTFKSIDDIRRALGSHTSTATILSSLRADAPAFVPKFKQVSTQGTPARGNASQDGAEQEEAEGEQEEAIDRPEADTKIIDSRDVVVANTAKSVAREVTPEELAVARRFLKGYRRRLLQRKLEKKKTTIEASCDSIFHVCLKHAEGMEWPNGGYYRMLYLGLVPHLLVCVNAVQTYAQGAKSKAKKRLLKEEKQDLDDLNKRMNDLSSMFKLSRELHKQLEPQSSLHKRRDVEELKRLVGQVEELVNRVPQAVGEVRLHLELAIKGIVKEKPPPKPVEKPELNIDEEDGYVDEAERFEEAYLDGVSGM